MDVTTLSAIREAIVNAHPIVFDYQDSDGDIVSRTVCPHILGRKSGGWRMLTWQVSDESKKGFAPGAARWRCFKIDRITDVASSKGEWHRGWVTGERDQSCVDDIDVMVDQAHAALVLSSVN